MAKTIYRVDIYRGTSSLPEERKDHPRFNSALCHLWRARNVREGYVIAIIFGNEGVTLSADKLVAKVGRRRGVNMTYTRTVAAGDPRRPTLKIGKQWQRLPNRFNDIK